MSGFEHRARFVAGGRTVREVRFADGVMSAPVPEVPRLRGMEGFWPETELGDRDIVIEAVYRPAMVRYIQYDGSSEVRRATDPAPEPLPYLGCEASWEPVRSAGDAVVRARYRGPAYSARFIADGREVFRSFCSAGRFSMEPPVPRKNGFKGRWPVIVPCAEHIIVHAVYEPVTIEFAMGIGKSVKVAASPGWRDRIPEVPARKGMTGEWSIPELGSADVVAVPVYSASVEPAEPVLDRSKVREALADLEFVAHTWNTLEADAPSGNREHTISDTADTDGAEGLAARIGAGGLEYLAACLKGRSESEAVLKRLGALRLAMEKDINAASEDVIGDPIVEDGAVDPDYEDYVKEMLNDGS